MVVTSLYADLGPDYDRTRRAEPAIVRQLFKLLDFQPEHTCVDIACGTGNYTIALSALQIRMSGVDAEPAMIAQARSKAPTIDWHVSEASSLPFADRSLHGATCILALHHMTSILPQVFREAFRILLDSGRFCIFTADPAQIQRYWLREYFPRLIEQSADSMPSVSTVKALLQDAGFSDVISIPYWIEENPVDLFLYAGKHHPEFYLDPAVRTGISSFANASPDELQEGLTRLPADVATGRFKRLKDQMGDGSLPGDYLFVTAHKSP